MAGSSLSLSLFQTTPISKSRTVPEEQLVTQKPGLSGASSHAGDPKRRLIADRAWLYKTLIKRRMHLISRVGKLRLLLRAWGQKKRTSASFRHNDRQNAHAKRQLCLDWPSGYRGAGLRSRSVSGCLYPDQRLSPAALYPGRARITASLRLVCTWILR